MLKEDIDRYIDLRRAAGFKFSTRGRLLKSFGVFAAKHGDEVYLRADPSEKIEALAAIASPMLRKGRFQSPDKLLAMLKDASKAKNYVD
jgi:hypothetical protein